MFKPSLQQQVNEFQIASWVQGLAPWSVIAHMTFKYDRGCSLDSAQRLYERFMQKNLSDVSYFYAIEENPSRDGHHIHALWAESSEGGQVVRRSDMWKRWFTTYGRNRIEPVRSHHDVSGYCSKYVSKDCFQRGWWNVKINSPDLWHQHKASPADKGDRTLRVLCVE